MMVKKKDSFYPGKEFQKRAWVKNKSIYKEAEKSPIKFWEKLAKELFWFKKWKKAFTHDPKKLKFQWFSGGKINITADIFENNFLGWDSAESGIKNKLALIWEPESTDEKERKFTYQELFSEVNRFANALKKSGVKKGDRVGIYLPMIPEAVISMLACARIGAVHAVVFSAFSAESLRVRLQDTKAKVLITVDGYHRRGKVVDLKKNADEGIKETSIEKIIIFKRAGNSVDWKDGRDFWASELTKNESDYCKPAIMDAEDLMFILYTSGSTGKPKGCEHVCGGYAVQSYWTGKWIFDLHGPARNASATTSQMLADAGGDDIFWCTADIGWVTGHTYAVYSPLLNGATSVIFEGAPDWPGPDRWAQIIEKYGITVFYTAPTAIRMFKKMGAEIIKKYGFKTLRVIGSVGEPIDDTAWNWYFEEVGRGNCPLVDTWWQTETGGILISSLPGVGPFKPSFTGRPFPGLKFDILDDNGKPVKTGKEGNLVLFPPFSPSLSRGIYKNFKKYKETYWSQYGGKIYVTSDTALKDKNGLIRIVGRADDVIKVAGHRITTGEMEAVINRCPEIAECAVIGVFDEIKGQVPVVFADIKGVERDVEKIKEDIVVQIRKEIGPIALPKQVYLVDELPKTRSGKIMRRILRKLFTGEELGDLSTLSNPEAVEEIRNQIIK